MMTDPENTPPGSRFPLLPGVHSRMVDTARLRQHVYTSGPAEGEPVLLVHGNASSARFFETLMAALPQYSIVAPDLRGYGASEALTVDATRGLHDYSDDLDALVTTLGWTRFHVLGWSLGGCIAMQYTIDHPERVRSLVLHATGSPFGYGGSHGPDGTPNYEDVAGSGGGLISPLVTERYVAQDSSADSPFAPRSGLRTLIVKPTFTLEPLREDILVEQMLLMKIGEQYYPGDAVPSPNWPFSGPGLYGSNNALSPKYGNQSALGDLVNGPPILWVRGADDQLVSDMAAADPAALGKLGVIPGWPGDAVCPPQPMLAQIRAVLDRYAANGGAYREHVFTDCGHAPLLEHADEFRTLLQEFIAAHPITAPAATPASASPETPKTPETADISGTPAPVPPAEAISSTTAATPERRSRRGLLGFLRR